MVERGIGRPLGRDRSLGTASTIRLCVARLLHLGFCVIVASLVWTPSANAEKRVALVIGNSEYAVSPLQNPSSDTDAIAKALGEIGFDAVLVKKNLGAAGMKDALREFSRSAAGSEIAVVFYAGHGMEMAGKNYLIPVDARLERASDIDLEAVSLDTVLGQLEGVRTLKLVILDACRNSAFRVAGGTRSVTRGLGRIEPEDNTLVAYAARAGTTADDGTGRQHSPFTDALLRHIATEGLDVRLMLGRVRDDVLRATNNAQMPHVYGTLGGASIFLLPNSSSRPASPVTNHAAAEAAWSFIRDSRDRAMLGRFIEEFPQSTRRFEADGILLCMQQDDLLKGQFRETSNQKFQFAVAALRQLENSIPDSCKRSQRVVAGSIIKIIPCYNNAIYFQLDSTGEQAFVWTEETEIGKFGRPQRKDQHVLALPGVAYYCVSEIYPLTVLPGVHVNAMRRRD